MTTISSPERIFARRMARELTSEELRVVGGADHGAYSWICESEPNGQFQDVKVYVPDY